MATYKVIQDIEAEDHILGPLTLRQFIYGLIAAFFLYINFICLTKGMPVLIAIFLPPALFFAFFAFPFGKDQPTEVWALAKIRFFLKPRRRLWNQSGVKELVTVTAPRKIEVQRTNGLSETEVKSRLQALADTIDSRGWAIKNVTADTYVQPSLLDLNDNSDRILSISSMPQPVPDYDVAPADDILDSQASPLAQQFTSLIDTSTKAHRQQLMDELNRVRTEATGQQDAQPQWFAQPPLSAPQPIAATPAPVPEPAQPADEAALAESLRERASAEALATANMHAFQPGSDDTPQDSAQPAAPAADPQPAASPAAPDPAILNLAKSNDLSVATLAREAKRTKDLDDSGDEVVIALH